MQLFTSIREMQSKADEVYAQGRNLALVPTMGALHEGHLSLVRQARSHADFLVVSIFVNPTQFGPSEDLDRYPRKLEEDMDRLRSLHIDGVFAPSSAEMYPSGFDTFVEPGQIALTLEGAWRPGHFRGVATVVLKLFNIIKPRLAYFGQKDFQQVVLIRRLVEDLNLPVRIVVCPIVREIDGLALSSRNVYLNAEDRRAALTLSQSLQKAQELVDGGETSAGKILEQMRGILNRKPQVNPDYVAIVEPVRLEPAERVTPGCVALIAARVGSTRLIDNRILGPRNFSPEELLDLALPKKPARTSASPRPNSREVD